MFDREFLFSIARHLLTKGAGALVTHGFMQGSDTEKFVGAGVFLAGLAWSFIEKQTRKTNEKLKTTPDSRIADT